MNKGGCWVPDLHVVVEDKLDLVLVLRCELWIQILIPIDKELGRESTSVIEVEVDNVWWRRQFAELWDNMGGIELRWESHCVRGVIVRSVVL